MSNVFFMIIPFIFMLISFGLYIWQAAWVAIDSRKRGEEYWWLWAIAAFISFPIGIIVYALVSRSDRRRCNNCGKEVPQNLNLCPYCGEKCGYFCPSCGQSVQAGWKFCPNCTAELPEEISNKSNRRGSNKAIIIIVSIIAVIAALFITIILVSVTSFSTLGSSYQEVSVIEENLDGYIGENYEDAITKVLNYTASSRDHSLWYKGERKKGEAVVKIYDNEGNLISESEPITDDVFAEGVLVKEGYKIEVDLNKYKGSFYVRFN